MKFLQKLKDSKYLFDFFFLWKIFEIINLPTLLWFLFQTNFLALLLLSNLLFSTALTFSPFRQPFFFFFMQFFKDFLLEKLLQIIAQISFTYALFAFLPFLVVGCQISIWHFEYFWITFLVFHLFLAYLFNFWWYLFWNLLPQ